MMATLAFTELIAIIIRQFVDLQLINAYVNVFIILPKGMLHVCMVHNLVDMHTSANA